MSNTNPLERSTRNPNRIWKPNGTEGPPGRWKNGNHARENNVARYKDAVKWIAVNVMFGDDVDTVSELASVRMAADVFEQTPSTVARHVIYAANMIPFGFRVEKFPDYEGCQGE